MITSPANERLKHARRVRDGREPGLIFLEGERLIEECLDSPIGLFACFHIPAPGPRAEEILNELTARGCPIFPTEEAVLETVSDTVNTQGLILLAERPVHTLSGAMVARAGEVPLIAGLDGIQDPGNFGTIVRTAEAAGATSVIALAGSVEAYAPKTLRSAMGSSLRLPIATDVEADELFSQASRHGMRVVATAGKGETLYSDFDWRGPTLVIFGNEARGISHGLMERCDARLRIPLRTPVESLNVAAAAAVILFEAVRQRGENP